MLRNTPISPVIKADAESDARFFFLRQYSFYSAVCSIEKKNTLRKASKRNQKALMNPSVDNKLITIK
jgi:hypothetical protein